MGFFGFADFDFMRFEERFGKPATLLLYWFVVDEYLRQPQELVEVKFEDGFFLLTKFQN